MYLSTYLSIHPQEEEEVLVVEEESTSGSAAAAAYDLPTSLRHGIYITPPAKMMDGLRRLLHTEPKPQTVMVFVNDAFKVGR